MGLPKLKELIQRLQKVYSLKLFATIKRDDNGRIVPSVFYVRCDNDQDVFVLTTEELFAGDESERQMLLDALQQAIQKSFVIAFYAPILLAVLKNIYGDWFDIPRLIDAGEYVEYSNDNLGVFGVGSIIAAELMASINNQFFQWNVKLEYKRQAINSLTGLIQRGLKVNATRMADHGNIGEILNRCFKTDFGTDIKSVDEYSLSVSSLKRNLSPKNVLVLKYKEWEREVSVIKSALQYGYHGSIYPLYHFYGSNTGRISSFMPPAQNWNKQIKDIFLPIENVFNLDLRQSQLRILAAVSGDDNLIDLFKQDVDIHTFTAKRLFGVDNLTPQQRKFGKTVNFAIVYGMTSYGLRSKLEDEGFMYTIEQCQSIIDGWFNLYPKVKNWIDMQVNDVRVNNKITSNVTGKVFNLEQQENRDRLAVNYQIQDIESRILGRIMGYFDNVKGVTLLLTEHDGITVQSLNPYLAEHVVAVELEILEMFPILQTVGVKLKIERR